MHREVEERRSGRLSDTIGAKLHVPRCALVLPITIFRTTTTQSSSPGDNRIQEMLFNSNSQPSELGSTVNSTSEFDLQDLEVEGDRELQKVIAESLVEHATWSS
jgi:hypothetical protein